MRAPDDQKREGLKAPPLPEVTRLNKNVLLVAAMGVAVVVLAVTQVVRSGSRAPAQEVGSGRVEPGAAASFLSDTSRTADLVPPPAYPEVEDTIDVAGVQEPNSSGGGAVSGVEVSSRQDAFMYGSAPVRDPREAAYERALRAGLRAEEDRGPGGRNLVAGMDARLAPDDYAAWANPRRRPMSGRDSTGIASTPAGESSLAAGRHRAMMGAASERHEPSMYERVRLIEPVSEYQLMAGTVIPAMMVTAMNSDMPGEVVAQISRNVYDSQQRHLLIPRGTKIIGRYDDQVALGQSRVLLAWTRLIFPDGRSLSLPGLPTKDLRGASGVRSHVNNHYGRLYGQATLLSLISAGAQLSQPQQSSVLAPSSAGQIAAGALGEELSRVSMETIRRNMDVRPTLEVEAGTPFYIFLEPDLVFDAPYVDPWTADDRPIASTEGRDPAASSVVRHAR